MKNKQPPVNKEVCPWDLIPLNIEAAVKSLKKLGDWETKNGPAPLYWKPIISVNLMLDILVRIQGLEAVYDEYSEDYLNQDLLRDPQQW